MKLYHGTSLTAYEAILRTGYLRPRNAGLGNWKHSLPSNPSAVYLTDVYAPYFAAVAAGNTRDGTGVIVEVDTNLLRPERLMPDEDYLEQITRGRDSIKPKSVLARTRYYRAVQDNIRHLWSDSLTHLGTAAHLGGISVKAITRVAVVDFKARPELEFTAMQPTISLANHRFCSARYHFLTAWLMGDPADVAQFIGYDHSAFPADDSSLSQLLAKERDQILAVFGNRAGITVTQSPV